MGVEDKQIIQHCLGENHRGPSIRFKFAVLAKERLHHLHSSFSIDCEAPWRKLVSKVGDRGGVGGPSVAEHCQGTVYHANTYLVICTGKIPD